MRSEVPELYVLYARHRACRSPSPARPSSCARAAASNDRELRDAVRRPTSRRAGARERSPGHRARVPFREGMIWIAAARDREVRVQRRSCRRARDERRKYASARGPADGEPRRAAHAGGPGARRSASAGAASCRFVASEDDRAPRPRVARGARPERASREVTFGAVDRGRAARSPPASARASRARARSTSRQRLLAVELPARALRDDLGSGGPRRASAASRGVAFDVRGDLARARTRARRSRRRAAGDLRAEEPRVQAPEPADRPEPVASRGRPRRPRRSSPARRRAGSAANE